MRLLAVLMNPCRAFRVVIVLLGVVALPLAVSAGPAIIGQPTSATTVLGGSVTLTVNAPSALSYQWTKNSSPVPSGTNASLPIPVAALSDVGGYWVTVTDGTGSTQSNTVTVAVTVPAPVPILANNATLKTPRYLATDGTDWLVSGTRADNSQAIFKFPVAGGAVSSIYFGLASPLAVATVGTDVYWIDPNAGVNTDTKIFKAPKSGAGPMTSIYTGAIVGEPLVDGSGLATDGTKIYAADEYAGKVFKMSLDGTGFASLTSGNRYADGFPSERLNQIAYESGVLYIADTGRFGANSPSPQVLSIPVGGTAFTSLVSGAPLVAPSSIAVLNGKLYVADPGANNTIWQIPLTGGTPVAYYAGAPLAGITGLAAYNGEIYVADSMGGAIYRLAQTPATFPGISAAPQPITTTNGATVTFSVTATGIPAVTYVWKFNGTPIPNATNATLTLTNVQSAQIGGYSVAVTNGVGTLSTAPVALSGPVVEPVFVSQPASPVSGNVGGSATLSVNATGSGLTYQWRKYGQAINGATNAALTLNALTPFDAGLYDVLVRTSGVDFASSAARVIVNAPVDAGAVLTAASGFAVRVENNLPRFRPVSRATDGKVYVSGDFASLFGALRPGMARLNADGSLDPTFTPVPASSNDAIDRVFAFAVQTDGKVLIGGDFMTVGGYARSCLARLNADGSLDRSFVPAFDFHHGQISALAVQSDGKIVAGGSFNDAGVNLARLNPDGTLDATFQSFALNGFNGSVLTLAVQGDGKILAGGDFTEYGGTAVGHLARLTTTGALDTAYLQFPGFNGSVASLVLQPDGKLIAGGDFTFYAGAGFNRVVRLLDTGVADPAFSIGAGFSDSVYQVALQADNKILVAGAFSQYDGITSKGLVRLGPTGARDTTLNTGSDFNAGFNKGTLGVATLTGSSVLVLAIDSTQYNSATANVGPLTRLSSAGALDAAYVPATHTAGIVRAIAPAPGGKWIIAGNFLFVNGVARANVARLNADGSLDTGFGSTTTTYGDSGPTAVVVQPDGKVIVGGEFVNYNGSAIGRIARFDTAGVLDAAFVTGAGFNGPVNALALQADGRVVVGGAFSAYNGTTRRALVRLTTTGGFDAAFAPAGTGFSANATVNTLAVLSDGHIYAGGDFSTYNGATLNRFGRFNADGTLDGTFATGTGFNSTVNACLVQADGEVVVAGYFNSYKNTDVGQITRLTPAGAIETGFPYVDAGGAVFGLALQGDGAIVASGNFNTFGSITSNPIPHLGRLKADGTVDATFRVPALAETPLALQITSAGKLLIGGEQLVMPGVAAPGLALLEPAAGAAISVQPVAQTAPAGANITFSVTATGTNLVYQWKKEGIAIPGATNATYFFASAQLQDVGAYSVVVSNIFATTTSAAVTLSGTGAAPTLTTFPGSVSIAPGASTTLTVAGSPVNAYQWRKLGVPISGATTASYTISGATLGDAAYYDVLVANGLSVTKSPAARVAVAATAAIQNTLSVDRTFPATFEPASGFGSASKVLVQPDGSYYIAGNFSSIDGAPRIGMARFSSVGVIDATFKPEIGGGSIATIARQTDGKLVIAGDFHRINAVECNGIARLNPDGSLDNNFVHGTGTGIYDNVYAVALQSDGKLLIGGNFTQYNGDASGNYLARLNPDGTLDTAFRTALGTGFNSTVYGIAVQTDGRIYVVGAFTLFNGSTSADNLVALNPDGSRFALAGLMESSLSSDSSVRAIVLQADGKMVLGGSFYTYNGNTVNNVMGLLADGSFDAGFAPGTGANSTVTSVVREADGHLDVFGSFSEFDGNVTSVARLTAKGAFDRGYYLDGSVRDMAVSPGGDLLMVGDFENYYSANFENHAVRTNFARFASDGTLTASTLMRWGSFEGNVTTVVAAPGGKWLVGGSFDRVGGVLTYNLTRLNADGTVDTAFSTAGRPQYGTVNAIAVQGDGKILVGGNFVYYGTQDTVISVGRLIRLNADGTADSTFNLGGGFDGEVNALAVQIDGKILVGGNFSKLDGRNVSPNFVRLLSDGSLDTGLQAGSGFDGAVRAIVVQRDDKILVGGEFTRYNSASPNTNCLVRMHANGAVETTFLIGGNNVRAIVLQPDESFIIGGQFTYVGARSRYAVARFTAAGTLDPVFNDLGLFNQGSESYAQVYALALQSDGKVIVGGSFDELARESGTKQLARLTATGTLDPTFGQQWFYDGTPVALAVRADGGLLLGGGAFDFNTVYRRGLMLIDGSRVASVLPAISSPPAAQAVASGGSATFSVIATGTPAPTYQWQRNGSDILFATNASYTITSATQAAVGSYRVVVTNAAGSVTSAAVPFAVITRDLVNFYARANVAIGGSIASSFTIEGTQPKSILLIGVGGARANAGAPAGSLADPRLVLVNSAGTVLGSNDNWTTGNTSALSAAAAQVAATPGLTPSGEGGKDAALLVTLAPGTYTATLDGADGGGGEALLQIYDADTDGRPRLVMATIRANVGAGANIVTAGFTLDGTLSRSFLIRALGQALGASNEVLEDPVITLFQGGTELDGNDDTSFDGPVPIAFSQVGARPTPSSLDSTLVETLTPGVYTVNVRPFGSNNSGTVLFELFQADAQRPAVIAPVITYFAPNQTVVQGTIATFGVVAVAKPAATYQWRKNGTPLDGETNPTLRVFNVQPTDVANYDVVVTSGSSSVTSPVRTINFLAEFHSADTDHDHRIGLLELTRVIQLYAYTRGTVRTGEYHTLAGTEDGFTLGPGTLTSYHSADSNHDGKIDAVELSRVIQLYNYVNGATRTGEYHAMGGTEDGFTPGPFVPKTKDDDRTL